MVRSNWGRDTGRDMRRAVGSWSHQLPSHLAFREWQSEGFGALRFRVKVSAIRALGLLSD